MSSWHSHCNAGTGLGLLKRTIKPMTHCATPLSSLNLCYNQSFCNMYAMTKLHKCNTSEKSMKSFLLCRTDYCSSINTSPVTEASCFFAAVLFSCLNEFSSSASPSPHQEGCPYKGVPLCSAAVSPTTRKLHFQNRFLSSPIFYVG